MLPGIAIQQTLTCGSRDLGECVTLSPGGPGRLTECLKCPRCGYSVTIGEAGDLERRMK